MESIGSVASIIYNGEMFFSHLEYNSLYKMKLDDLSVEWVCRFPDAKIDKKLMHRKAIMWNDEIFFFPLDGHIIHKYIPEKNEIVSVCNIDVQDAVKQLSFADVVQCNNKAYLIPQNSNSEFIEFNLDTLKIRIIQSWKALVLNKISKEFRIAQCATVYEGKKLFTAVRDTNLIISYDTVSEKVDILKLRNNIKLRNMEVCGDIFLFSLMESPTILRWNFRTDEHRYITDDKIGTIFRPFTVDNEVYILPIKGAALYKINEDMDLICNISKVDECMEEWRFRTFMAEEGQIYFMPQKGKKLMLYDKKNRVLKLENVQFIDSVEKRSFENDLIHCWLSEGCFEGLDTGLSLSRFISFISKEQV